MTEPKMLSAAQLEGIKLFGSREVERDGFRVTEPAQGTEAVRALLKMGYYNDEAGFMKLLTDADVSGPGIEYFREHKMLLRPPFGVDGVAELHPNIPGVTADNLSEYAGTETEFGDTVEEVRDDRPLVYKLNTLFSDTTITDKLQLSSRRLQSAKRLALSDPAGAAASLTDYLRANGYPKCKVTAGDYAQSTRRACEYIRKYAKMILYTDDLAPATVQGGVLRITFDNFVKDPQWTVEGPVKYATEVEAIYQMAVIHGPEWVMNLCGIETLRLRINIFNAKTNAYYSGMVTGYSNMSGIQPLGTAYPSDLTAEQRSRLYLAAKKVLPVYVGDAVVGSAVQVSDKHVILNEHTLTEVAGADKVANVAGQPVHDHHTVAHDLCVIKRAGSAAQWVIRCADTDERVVLCYSVGSAVEFSEVLRVQSVHKQQIVLSDSDVLRKGASGAAVISLRDCAMLGLFSTKRGSSVLCTAFTSSTFETATDFESVVSESVRSPQIAQGDLTYDRMVRRGLEGFLVGIGEATAPLYVNTNGVTTLAGTVVNCSGKWYTTVNPDKAQVYLNSTPAAAHGSGMPLAFRTEADKLFSVLDPPPLLSSAPNVRYVNPGERVFVLSKSYDDVVMSSVRVVTHCMADMQQFVVEDFGETAEVMMGGVVVAEKDCAVVGQYASLELDRFGNPMVMCVSLNKQVPIVAAPAVETQSVIAELRTLVDGDGRLDAASLVAYGEMLVKLVIGVRSYNLSGAVDSTVVISEVDANIGHILRVFGAVDCDFRAFGVSAVEFVQAFLALQCVRDMSSTIAKLYQVFAYVDRDRTPVVAEFPFPRPLSANSMVGIKDVMPDSSEARLRELEFKFEALTARLSDKTPHT